MELNHLKYFYVVAKEGGFTRASRVLRIQQPAISKIVRQLEDRWGVRLLERQKKSTTLTHAGEEVFLECEKIFGAVENIERLLGGGLGECQGPLRLGCSDVLASSLLPDILRDLLKAHPRVSPSIFTGPASLICEEIRNHSVELGLFFTPPSEEWFDVVELAHVSFRLVVSKAHFEDERVLNSWIGSREADYPKARSFPAMEMLRAQRLNPRTKISANNLEAQLQCVLKGLGVALLPEFMVGGLISKKRLAVIYPEKKFVYSIKQVTRKGKVLSRNAVEFMQRVRKRLERHRKFD